MKERKEPDEHNKFLVETRKMEKLLRNAKRMMDMRTEDEAKKQ